MKWLKGILMLAIIILLSLIFAQQYEKGCSIQYIAIFLN